MLPYNKEQGMMGYTKLFTEIIMSTVWREKDHVRLLWITMLALKDRWHVVNASLPGLADSARITMEECEDALERLSAPDPHSRTKDYEGRRIDVCDGGWIILNGEKYRNKMSLDERREYQRIKQREYRARDKVKSCQQSGQQLTHTEADTYTETIKTKPSKSDDLDFDIFWDNYPKKVDKKKARVAFNNLKTKHQAKATEDCKARYQGVAKCFVPNPTTYIHGERWNDEVVKKEEGKTNIEAMAKDKGLSPRKGESQTEWEQRVRNTR